jgi:hypothetical protein
VGKFCHAHLPVCIHRGAQARVIMTRQRCADSITELARNLLRNESTGGVLAATSGRLEPAVAVRAPDDGLLHSWYLPVTIDNRLIGFFQFLPEGTLMRYSSFQRHEGDISACPLATEWLDPVSIRKSAEAYRQPGESTGKPFLTYDRSPDRIVWAVPFTRANGKTRLVHVAGRTVYPPNGK